MILVSESVLQESAFLWLPFLFYFFIEFFKNHYIANAVQLQALQLYTYSIGGKNYFKKQAIKLLLKLFGLIFLGFLLIKIVFFQLKTISVLNARIPVWMYLVLVSLIFWIELKILKKTKKK